MVRPWLFGLAVSALVFLALVFLPARLLRHDQETFSQKPVANQNANVQPVETVSAIDHYRGTLAQVFGGVAICLGLYFTARNVFAAEQTRWTRTFSDAVGQLGAVTSAKVPNIPIRVGAVYSLERLCHDSPADAPAVCNILLHYIQAEAVASRKQNFMLDCEAALLALSSITRGRTFVKSDSWPLSDVFLPNLRVLDRKVAGFHFKSSTLSGSRFDRSHNYSLQIEDCSLEGCSFAGSKINGTIFSASKGSGLNFSSCKAEKAQFLSCVFQDSDFTYARLVSTNFSDTDVSGSDFSNADLRNVVASGTNMTGVSLHNANLRNADLRGAIGITNAEMASARVKPPQRFMPSNLVG